MRLRTRVAAALLAAAPAIAPAQTPTERFAVVCATCHGAQGVSAQPLTPSLAGQPAFYAITQLFLFREGRRDNALMTAVAKDMSNDDLRAFSDLIAALPPPPPPGGERDAARAARGAALAQRLHCAGCHGADYAGGKQVPRLAGQREDYLALSLRGFRAATRVGYTQAMTEALAGTAPADLDDLAHYLAAFKP
jgi:cytochrome c553